MQIAPSDHKDPANAPHPGRVRITIDQPEGTPPVTITIDTGAATPAITTSSTPAAAVVTPPTEAPATAIVTNNQPALPDAEAINYLKQGDSAAAKELSNVTDFYEGLEAALHSIFKEAFPEKMQSTNSEMFRDVVRQVNIAMQDLIKGSLLLELPADELTALKQDIAHEALLNFKSHQQSINPQSLKTIMEPKVEAFAKKSHTRKQSSKDKPTTPHHHAAAAHHHDTTHDPNHLHRHHGAKHEGTVTEAAPTLEQST